jgi:hypothetical protein
MSVAFSVPPLPDVEAIVYSTISDLGGIQSFAYDAGSSWPFVSDRVCVQIDVYAASKKAAHDKAYEVRRRLIELPFGDMNVSLVEVIAGPFWQQADDGAPRYIIRTAVTVRGYRGLSGRK